MRRWQSRWRKADILIDHGSDALPVPSQAKPLIARELEWPAKKRLPPCRARRRKRLAGSSSRRGMRSKRLASSGRFNLDTRVQVSTRDITRYRSAQILLSYPVDGGAKLKIRQPTARFKKQRREPTERELEGLRKANERRAAEAKARRSNRAATPNIAG